MTWIAQTALVVLMATLGGCLSPRGEASPMHTYQLGLDARPGEAPPSAANAPVLLVSLPQAQPGFETPRMAYLKRPYELEYYAVNQWADTPARLFAPLLVQALGQTGLWRAVIPLPNSIRGDYRLDSYGFALQQEFLQQPSRVRVTVHVQLIDLKESRVVSAGTFETAEEAQREDAYGGVLAANKAVAKLLDQVASWLQSCVRHQPECNR
ncbi:MAG: ABC-type transport auxiliary lipoprotein family protein [Phycisphaerales bacterium]|nr:ABC-type transport auxiliary lipoprotein family protein [Phycisphaerales bacterium]